VGAKEIGYPKSITRNFHDYWVAADSEYAIIQSALKPEIEETKSIMLQ